MDGFSVREAKTQSGSYLSYLTSELILTLGLFMHSLEVNTIDKL